MENHSLEMKINELENKIDFLSSQLLSHIEFINKTYDTMRAPLLFFCEKINILREGYINKQELNESLQQKKCL